MMTYEETKEIQDQRPKMNYVDFTDSWTSVAIDDRFYGSWQWGAGPYYDWCDENCRDKYNIVKYRTREIIGRFKDPADAVMFKLRWS